MDYMDFIGNKANLTSLVTRANRGEMEWGGGMEFLLRVTFDRVNLEKKISD